MYTASGERAVDEEGADDDGTVLEVDCVDTIWCCRRASGDGFTEDGLLRL